MRSSRPTSGITLLNLLVVVFILAFWAAVRIAQDTTDRRRAAEVRAQAALKRLVSTEGVWRSTDSDRNGSSDYWTRDIAGFYALLDGANDPLHYIDGRIATADVAPAMDYPGLPAYEPKIGYRVRARTVDETGAPYVDATLAPATAAPVAGRCCTNRCIFAFCAWLVGESRAWRTVFIVNEEGVVYRLEGAGPAPVTTWPGTQPSNPWFPTE